MNDHQHLLSWNLDTLTKLWMGTAVLALLVALRQTQPYGRHISDRWGPLIDNRLGWILQELPSPLCLSYFFFTGDLPKTAASYFFWALWVLHYGNRSVIFPLRTRTAGKRIPLLIVAAAFCFNLINGSLNGHWLGSVGGVYGVGYFTTPRFLAGAVLFILGAAANNWADNVLIGLRRPGGTGYQIPRGGLFRYVSCPNLLGEIVEWLGFAVMVGSLPAWSFALWTGCNLIPRALDHHRWYQQRFGAYPKERRAIIPFLL